MGEHKVFPDTNILLDYLREYEQDDHLLALKLFSVIKPQAAVEGFLIPGIKDEFDGLTENKRISAAFDEVQKIYDETRQTNSTPTLMKKLNELIEKTDTESTRTFVSFVLFRLAKINQFDEISIVLGQLSTDYKYFRNLVKSKLIDCVKYETEFDRLETNQKETVDKLKVKFNEIFPLKKQNDEKDNLHLLYSALFTKLIQKPTIFLTNDVFRRPRDFTIAVKDAEKEVKTQLNVDMRIRKPKEFIERELSDITNFECKICKALDPQSRALLKSINDNGYVCTFDASHRFRKDEVGL
jgi:hypothetical protein